MGRIFFDLRVEVSPAVRAKRFELSAGLVFALRASFRPPAFAYLDLSISRNRKNGPEAKEAKESNLKSNKAHAKPQDKRKLKKTEGAQ